MNHHSAALRVAPFLRSWGDFLENGSWGDFLENGGGTLQVVANAEKSNISIDSNWGATAN